MRLALAWLPGPQPKGACLNPDERARGWLVLFFSKGGFAYQVDSDGLWCACVWLWLWLREGSGLKHGPQPVHTHLDPGEMAVGGLRVGRAYARRTHARACHSHVQTHMQARSPHTRIHTHAECRSCWTTRSCTPSAWQPTRAPVPPWGA